MFVTKLGENFIEGITLFKGQCKACNSEFYFEEKEAKELYEKIEKSKALVKALAGSWKS